MRKKTLNISDLKRIVSESVRRVLFEAKGWGNYDIEALRRKYKEYNEEYFDGQLKDVEIKLVNWPTSKYIGVYKYYLGKTRGIVETEYWPSSVSIELNMAFVDDEERINNTLLHEMCHQYVFEVEVYGQRFDTLSRSEIAKFEKSFNADNGHGELWLRVAEQVSRESGYKITPTSDIAQRTDKAQAVIDARNSKENEIVVGLVQWDDGGEWNLFLTDRKSMPKIPYGYQDDVKWKWFAMRTNGLNTVSGWRCRSRVSKFFGIGPSVEAAIEDFYSRMGKYIGRPEIYPIEAEEHQDYPTHIGIQVEPFTTDDNKWFGWSFKPSAALIKKLGCGEVHDLGIDGKVCIVQVNDKDISLQPGGNIFKSSKCLVKGHKTREDAISWYKSRFGEIPREFEGLLLDDE